MTLQWRWLLPLLANRSHTTRSLRCFPYLEHILAASVAILAAISGQRFTDSHLQCYTPNILQTLSPANPGLRKLLISDIIVHDPQTANLRVRTTNKYPRFRRLCRKTIALLLQGQILLSPAFLPLCIPGSTSTLDLDAAIIDLTPLCRPCVSRVSDFGPLVRYQSYRRYLLSQRSLEWKQYEPAVSSASWASFWRLPLPPTARNTWYRLLHRTIPCKQRFHALLPNQHPSALCSFCGSSDEAMSHFFFSCSHKAALWTMALHKPFPGFSCSLPHIEQSMLAIAVSHIRNSCDTLSPIALSISLLSLFGCTLQVIWQSQWQKVFHDTHFTCPTMFASLE
ncbi:hypothetical protein CU097_013644 [Rhizopus azygosporus]|uniref:Reverse transcriptase zinc-binding domain-containing protein n=1 Tax=Rhizopus azygosporus TaxID=86630 RepID=A0A367K6Q4_RHIAZ|nr:hypothetical protein CU097_013644 [Rhizopus azygosporus]